MVQNHLMQLLTLVAMEPPIAFTAESVRDRKMDALLSVQPLTDADSVVRAQYRGGWVAGAEVPGYRGEPGVSPASTTEKFVALLHERATRLAEVRVVCMHLSGHAVLPFLQRGWKPEPIPRTVVPGRTVILLPPAGS